MYDKFKNRSHRYEVNRPRARHGYKHAKYKKGLGMMMASRVKQHLSII